MGWEHFDHIVELFSDAGWHVTVPDFNYRTYRSPGVLLQLQPPQAPASDSTPLSKDWAGEAKEKFRASAEGQYKLGVCYSEGLTTFSQDDEKALQWFRKAADQGHAPAAFNL